MYYTNVWWAVSWLMALRTHVRKRLRSLLTVRFFDLLAERILINFVSLFFILAGFNISIAIGLRNRRRCAHWTSKKVVSRSPRYLAGDYTLLYPWNVFFAGACCKTCASIPIRLHGLAQPLLNLCTESAIWVQSYKVGWDELDKAKFAFFRHINVSSNLFKFWG